jgi:hypothetical protein
MRKSDNRHARDQQGVRARWKARTCSAAPRALALSASALIAVAGVSTFALANSSARPIGRSRTKVAGAKLRCTTDPRVDTRGCAMPIMRRRRLYEQRSLAEGTRGQGGTRRRQLQRAATGGEAQVSGATTSQDRSADPKPLRRATAGWADHVVSPNGTASASGTCFDRKAAHPNGCWVPPTGYAKAPKRPTGASGFRAIPVPSGESSEIPPGTISTEMQGPFSASDYVTENAWWNEEGGKFYDVYAGAMGSDPSQGVVVVFTGPLGGAQSAGAPSLRAFPSAGRSGALRITSAEGWILTLHAADGATYRFDVKTSQYLPA